MRRLMSTFTLLMLFVLATVPALAQETEAEAPTWRGLGLLMLLVGLGAASVVGFYMARREASADEGDLI